MKKLILNKQQGVGLIEVLITTVVVAIGLLALASLQGDFMLSSGDSKVRSEALVLAEKQIESLRNNIVMDDGAGGGYFLIPNSNIPVEEEIVGTNAVFTRSWVINQGGTADRKKISVIITWDSDGGEDSDGDGFAIDDDERINVVTEMAFMNPAKSALYSGGASGSVVVPSPRQNASEDISAASEDVIGTDLAIKAFGTGSGNAGADQQLQVDPETGVALILSQVASGSHYYTAVHDDYPAKIELGVIAVFLCDNRTTSCSHIQNHFGGVVHRVKGTVYSTSGHDLSARFVAWTSSATHACYNGVVTHGTDIDEMPYECVYAGNCDVTDPGTRTASGGAAPNDEGCFIDTVVSNEQIAARNVGPGGEYGDTGLLGLDHSGGDIEQVCFLENTAASTSILLDANSGDPLNENYLYAVTKRFYVTRRVEYNAGSSINDHKNEGINRSYTNHNFFIADRKTGPSTKTECRDQVVINHQKEVATREVSRVLNEGTDNAVTYELAYSGGTGEAQTLIGDVTSKATKLRLFISEMGACYLDNNLEDPGVEAEKYACVIGSNASTADIAGSSNTHKSPSFPSAFTACSRDVNADPGCHWVAGFTNTYVDGGTGDGSCAAPWGGNITNGDDVLAYAITNCTTAETRLCTDGALGGNTDAIYQTMQDCEDAANVGASCDLADGSNIIDGADRMVFTERSVDFNSSCPSAVNVACDDGSLIPSGTYYKTCIVKAACFVPRIDGMSTSTDAELTAVNNKILDAGLVANGVFDSNLTQTKVVNQSPKAKTEVNCESTVSFDYIM